MTSGDIAFILLFIVLPTAIIVSGFWAILFVIRSPERNAGSPTAADSSNEQASVTEAEILVVHDPDPVPAQAEARQEAVPATVEAEPQTIDELNPVVADLLSDEAARIEQAAATNQAAIELADTPSTSTPAFEPSEISPTEEIPEMADPLLVDLAIQEQDEVEYAALADIQDNIVQIDEWRSDSPDRDAPDEDVQPGSADVDNMTVDLATVSETQEDPPQPATDEDPLETSETPDQSRQKQPKTTLLVPSHTAERKNRRNSRTAGRRVPQINRSTRRDESVVERDDSVSDL